MSVYTAVPERPNGACLVVLQEIFGVNANVRSITEEFAGHGFWAVAPDLFWRQQPDVQLDPTSEADREQASALMKGLDVDQAVADAGAALEFAQSQTMGSGATMAVGYCLGGKLAFLMAARGLVATAVSYYGVGIQAVLDEAAAIRGRILLHIAQEDHLCPPVAQQAIIAAMAPLGKRAQTLSYPGVGHAFARRGGAGFDRDKAKQADRATLEFLETDLGLAK